MSRYPWRNTSEDIAGQAQSQWETPSGAQEKADAAELAAKEYSDDNLNAHIGTGGDAHALAVPNAAAGFISGADQAKINSVSTGAEVNQNTFSQVNNVLSTSKTDTLTVEGGIGITVSGNPVTRKLIITATGESTPGAHGSSHNNDGSDPIPDLVLLREDFDSLTPADIGAETPAGTQEKVDDLGATVAVQLADIAVNVKVFGAVGDGTTDDYLAIKAAVDSLPTTGGKLLFPPGTYLLGSTVTVNKTVEIVGAGFATVITGSANPLLTTDQDTSHKFSLSNCKVVTTGSNIGVYINKEWSGGAVQTFQIENVWFYANGNAGSLLKIYGARESGVSTCIFEGILSWAGSYGSAIGVELVGDTVGGAMNLQFQNCRFLNIYQAVKGFGNSSRSDLFAGFHFNNCTTIGCNIGVEFANGGVFTYGDGMIDFCKSPIILRHWGAFNIHDNYIACKDEVDTAIWVTGEYGNTIEGSIHDNEIFTYGEHTSPDMTARGIFIDAATGSGGVQHIKIHDNFFRNLASTVYVNGKNFTYTTYMIQIHHNDVTKCKEGVHIGQYAVNCTVDTNLFDLVTTPIFDLGTRTIKENNRVDDLFGKNSGVFAVSSTAGTYTYQVTHGLYAGPSYVVASPNSTQTRDLGQFNISFDETFIYFNFSTPTASGLALKWAWIAGV
ncbi:glycosyl hydrolase family 28-related protein [Paenibacillus tundrae]